MSVEIYLWLNCILYSGFAGWCLLKPTATATFSGLSFLNTSGRAEYFAVYVGMEAGWAVFYLLCALNEELYYAGILFSVCIYAGIVLFRWVSILQKGASSKNGYYIAILEMILLAWAVILLMKC
ncbi:MAG: hypothetical protein ACKVPJ_03755 [Chitinophagales bacterium]